MLNAYLYDVIIKTDCVLRKTPVKTINKCQARQIGTYYCIVIVYPIKNCVTNKFLNVVIFFFKNLGARPMWMMMMMMML